MQKYNLFKKRKKTPLKETKILQDIIRTKYNESQVSTQAKISSFQ
jgi:hypothetical protein